MKPIPRAVLLIGILIELTACAARPPAHPTEHARERRTAYATAADGVQLAIEEVGPRDAPAIVFIHGLGFSREVWRHQMEGPLAERYHLIAYDLRGHGRSAHPTDQAAYEAGARWADDLHTVLTATHAKNAVVVGWSLGGLVIAHYLRVHGDAALGGSVFVDAVIKLAPELFAPGIDRYMAELADPRDDLRQAATRRFIQACFAKPPSERELEALVLAAGVLPASTHVAIQRMALERTEAALRALRRPALVIHGVHDALIAEAMARYARELVPAARLSLYESSGHAPFFEEAARFDAELARFVEDAHSRQK